MKEEESQFALGSFADEYGVKKYLTEVQQGSIKRDITSDFVLAKLTETQRDAIIELVRVARFAKKEIEKYAKSWYYKPMKNGKYVKNKDGSFRRFELSKEEKQYINNLAIITFDSYMIKLTMTVIMYRNLENNVLMELLTEKNKLEAEIAELTEKNKTVGQKAKDRLKNEETD